jgi:transposase
VKEEERKLEEKKTMAGPAAADEFAAFVAIDWGNSEHHWVLQAAGGQKREHGKLAHTPEAIEEWASSLARRFGERAVAVALEQSRGALVCALSRYRHLTIYPIPPAASAGFRAFASPSGSKSDSQDAGMLLDILLWHREKFRPLRPDNEQTRKLQALVEMRRQLVDEKTAVTNRVTAQLKLCFPQVLDWFDEIGSPLTVAFVRRWPTLPQLQAGKPETILEFLHSHNCRSESRNRQRLQQIASAQPLTTDPAVIEPGVMMIRTLLDVLEHLRNGISEMERAIEGVCEAHPDFGIFASFPGAGPALAPRLLAAFGSDRSRFESAAEVQTFSGIAPVISQSGQSKWIHFRWACPKFFRQTFHEFAGVSIQFCEWARAFYDRQRAKGKGHQAAVRALAFKWIRVLFACWRDRKPYDDRRHADNVALRSLAVSAPMRPNAAAAPQPSTSTGGNPLDFLFKSIAGFAKFSARTS